MSVHKKRDQKGVINVALIAERNIPNKSKLTSDQLVKVLMELSHVRLDREQLSEIDNLDCLGPVTNLYLQHNQIQKIENLEMLSKLRFLTLEGNQITKVEGLKCLRDLKFLDLSDNLIENFDTEQFPPRLIILSLKGNPCTNIHEYRSQLIKAMPSLQQLDGEAVTMQERQDAGYATQSNDEDDEDDTDKDEEDEDENEGVEDGGIYLTKKGGGALKEHTDNIIVRAKIRAMKAEAEHDSRLQELNEIRNLHSRIMAVTRKGTQPK